MKHAHGHTHPGQDGEPDVTHGHFHEHEGRSADLAQGSEGRKAHKGEPHEHDHTTRKVTVEITFDVGTLEEIGLGGFKTGWLSAEHEGRDLDLTSGAGLGSPYLEASVRGPEGQPSVYAQADIRTLVSDLWHRMEAIQAEMAAAKAGPVPDADGNIPADEPPGWRPPDSSDRSEVPATSLPPDQLDLLRSYASGPKIWDAAALQPAVGDLQDRRLIEPVPGHDRPGVFRLTAAGRQVLTAIGGQEDER